MAVTAVLFLPFLGEQFPCIKPRAVNKSKASLDVCWVSDWGSSHGSSMSGLLQRGIIRVREAEDPPADVLPGALFLTGIRCEEATATLCLLQILTTGKGQLP